MKALTLIFAMTALPFGITDWDKATSHAEQGKTVRLKLIDCTNEKGDAFSVWLVDGQTEYIIGLTSFGHLIGPVGAVGGNKGTFLYDLGPLLRAVKKPISYKAKIVLRTTTGTGATTYRDLEITLPGAP